MKQLIESHKSINKIAETISLTNILSESVTGWNTIKDQPNVKIMLLHKQVIEGNTITQYFSKTSLQQLNNLSKRPPQIIESFSLFLKPNSSVGTFVEDRLTLIYIPMKSDCIVYTWNQKKTITIPNTNQDCLIAIADNTPFSLYSKSANNFPLTLFFNHSTQNDFLRKINK